MSAEHEPPAPEVKPGQRCYVRNLDLTPELQKAVDDLCRIHGYRKARDRQRVEDDLKLQYYFGGRDIAYLVTPDGLAVVAAGDCESEAYREAMAALSPREWRAAVRYTPRPWNDDTYLPMSFFADEV